MQKKPEGRFKSWEKEKWDKAIELIGAREKNPAAFLVFFYLWTQSHGIGTKSVQKSYQEIADSTGLSKSSTQKVIKFLKERKLLQSYQTSKTAIPLYFVEEPGN